MIARNFDGSVIGWFDCVARGAHRFNQAGICMACGAERRGPEVVLRGGPQRPRPKSSK